MPTIKQAINQATVGLIGDKVKTITSKRLYARTIDQCERLGINHPSWAKFVEEARATGITFPNFKTAKLPARKSL